MWPVLLDMTKEESMQCLRNLELEAYAHLVSALRAQGPLNPDKRKLLKDTGLALNIPQDRHKAEVRRAINDEKLNTIAYHVTGLTESLDDWAQEGRRTVPLIPRMAPQTAYSAIADEVADGANQNNKQLPSPAATERKRTSSQSGQMLMPEMTGIVGGKGIPFRIPDLPNKVEESKKRKLPICTESNLAQHLLGSVKMNRTQQLYRQRTKNYVKESNKIKLPMGKLPMPSLPQTSLNGPKTNVTALPMQSPSAPVEETIEQIQNEINSYASQKMSPEHQQPHTTTMFSDNQASPVKSILSAKTLPSAPFKQITAVAATLGTPTAMPGPSGDMQKTLKMCSTRKPVKPIPLGQKLIVVSNAQTLQSSSILQKTLSVPLVKNISVKNLEKFKIVTTGSTQLTSAAHGINSFKHKVLTLKTNPTTKKVIPLSQLLSAKGGIKVLPYGGKIVGKTITTTASQPLYIVNTVTATQHPTIVSEVVANVVATEQPGSPNKENNKSSVLGDILKASGVTSDDFDAQIEEFRIPNNHLCISKSDSGEVAESASVNTEDDSAKYIGTNGTEQADSCGDAGPDACRDFLKTQFVNIDDVGQQVVLQIQNSGPSHGGGPGN